jgi:hypothetical protein
MSDPDFKRFTRHFDVLGVVLNAMFDAITGELDDELNNPDSGQAYERCAELDESIAVATRLFVWYAVKYDQRRDADVAPTLRAADEVVRSCWSEPFRWEGRTPPTGPLAYLDDRFDAFATPRVSVPSDLRAARDAPVAEHLRELPIPTIALPEFALREAWWLVLAAHETGHHVQKDLRPGLEEATRESIASAVASSVDGNSGAGPDPGARPARDPDAVSLWSGWGLEAFADAYSAAMVGEAAEWAIDELQYSTLARLSQPARAGSRYPPPLLRLELMDSCLRAIGLPVMWRRAAPARRARAGGLNGTLRSELSVTPSVAAALAALPVGGRPLRDLAEVEPAVLARPALLTSWADRLAGHDPHLGSLSDAASARLVVASGVAAYRAWADDPAADEVLPVIHSNLLALLPDCGPPGGLGPAPPPTQVTDLARRLARRLVTEPFRGQPDPDEDGS